MKTSIDVRNRDEGDVIRLAMEDRETRVYVLITGLLLQLPNDAARSRVLRTVTTMHVEYREVEAGEYALPVPGNGRGGLRLHDGDTDTGE